MNNELKFSTEEFDYLELEILINPTWGKLLSLFTIDL